MSLLIFWRPIWGNWIPGEWIMFQIIFIIIYIYIYIYLFLLSARRGSRRGQAANSASRGTTREAWMSTCQKTRWGSVHRHPGENPSMYAKNWSPVRHKRPGGYSLSTIVLNFPSLPRPILTWVGGVHWWFSSDKSVHQNSANSRSAPW